MDQEQNVFLKQNNVKQLPQVETKPMFDLLPNEPIRTSSVERLSIQGKRAPPGSESFAGILADTSFGGRGSEYRRTAGFDFSRSPKGSALANPGTDSNKNNGEGITETPENRVIKSNQNRSFTEQPSINDINEKTDNPVFLFVQSEKQKLDSINSFTIRSRNI